MLSIELSEYHSSYLRSLTYGKIIRIGSDKFFLVHIEREVQTGPEQAMHVTICRESDGLFFSSRFNLNLINRLHSYWYDSNNGTVEWVQTFKKVKTIEVTTYECE